MKTIYRYDAMVEDRLFIDMPALGVGMITMAVCLIAWAVILP